MAGGVGRFLLSTSGAARHRHSLAGSRIRLLLGASSDGHHMRISFLFIKYVLICTCLNIIYVCELMVSLTEQGNQTTAILIIRNTCLCAYPLRLVTWWECDVTRAITRRGLCPAMHGTTEVPSLPPTAGPMKRSYMLRAASIEFITSLILDLKMWINGERAGL